MYEYLKRVQVRRDLFTAAASVAAVREVSLLRLKQPYTSHTHQDEYAVNYCTTIVPT